MRKIFDVRCPSGHLTEVFGYLDDTFRCGECGQEAKRIISPIRVSLEGTSGDFPSAADKWAKRHEKAAKRVDNG
jgi:hypothetical protein